MPCTIHSLVSAHGSEIRNSFGVRIATVTDPLTAGAIADLINMGVPAAEAQSVGHDDSDTSIAKMLRLAASARP